MMKGPFKRRLIRLALMSVSAAATIAVAAPATAQAQVRPFNIPAQPLSSALLEFSRQSDVMIAVSPELTNGRRAPALRGSFLVNEAIARLLRGSGLRAVPNPRGGYLVESISSAGPRTAPLGEGEAGGAAADSAGPDDQVIIVTAQKREERLEDVPIAISVLRGEDLDRSSLEGVSEALTLVPGVKIAVNFQGGGTQISMRGVSASSATAAGSGTVGYYIDTVPFGLVQSAVVPDANLYDLERIEVLRGPQGTLYGANSLNGVVRILTREADLNEFQVRARATFSTTEGGDWSERADAAINVPIVTDRLGARLVLGRNNLGGWIDSPTARNINSGEITNVRLRLDGQLTDDLSVGLFVWAYRSHLDAPSISDDQRMTTALVPQPTDTEFEAYGLRVSYEFPLFTLTSMTSHIDYLSDSELDLRPFNPALGSLRSVIESNVWSEEISLASNHAGNWRWSLGGFYRKAEDGGFQTAVFLPPPGDGGQTSESVAAFGEITRIFAGGEFEFTGGLRYFHDDVRAREVNAAGVQLLDVTTEFETLSPRLVLTWHPSDDVTLYSSYSEGFRSGFEQSSVVRAIDPSFQPVSEDTLRNYEIGAHGRAFGGNLTFDAAIYYIDWQDVQQVLTVGVIPFPAPINAGSASGPGVDLALNVRPLDGLRLGASLSWNDLTFDDDVISSGAVLFDAGDRPNFSAEYTAGAEIEYEFPFGQSDFSGRFLLSGNYSSEQAFRTIVARTRRLSVGDDIFIVRSSFAVNTPYGLSVTLFADNLFDEDGASVRPTLAVTNRNTYPRPRTFGLQLGYEF